MERLSARSLMLVGAMLSMCARCFILPIYGVAIVRAIGTSALRSLFFFGRHPHFAGLIVLADFSMMIDVAAAIRVRRAIK
jgi:hypothetical protein